MTVTAVILEFESGFCGATVCISYDLNALFHVYIISDMMMCWLVLLCTLLQVVLREDVCTCSETLMYVFLTTLWLSLHSCFDLQGVLSSDPIILNGPSEPYVRFGHAMANLGDINSDGFEGMHFFSYFHYTLIM